MCATDQGLLLNIGWKTVFTSTCGFTLLGKIWYTGLPDPLSAMSFTSDHPHLSGNYSPVDDELDVSDLPVTAGRIPETLNGVYMRNGPNPVFPPISYTYPFDGDGMVHALSLHHGRARYRNRLVETCGLKAERRAGRALYGGVLHPVPVDPALIGPDGEPGLFKNGAAIHIIHHGGRLLALNEAGSAYEMTMELETVGEWHAGGNTPLKLCAHTRRDPATDALIAITYELEEPLAYYHHINAEGRLVHTTPVPLHGISMLHDFVLTENHIVLFACPVVFDLSENRSDPAPLQWRPELGTRIGLLPRSGGSPRWLETEAFFVFHFANGFERDGRIVIDYVRHAQLRWGMNDAEKTASHSPRLHRIIIDTENHHIEDHCLSRLDVEFPRAHDLRNALPTRYVYAPTRTRSGDPNKPPVHNAMTKFDAETGDVVMHDFGMGEVGEAVFVPRGADLTEDDGYLVMFVYDPARQASDFVILDAKHVAGEPVAVVRLPRRVPHGLHGSWISPG